MTTPMTASELHRIVEPVWKAIPETIPPRMLYNEDERLLYEEAYSDKGFPSRVVFANDHAESLCCMAMVRWLPYARIRPTTWPREGWMVEYGAREHWGRTLVEALADACLKLAPLASEPRG